jgi:hypothetical protein
MTPHDPEPTLSGRVPQERPLPPWHPFPLTELLVFIAVLSAGAAFVTWGTIHSLWLAGAGLSIGLLAGLELTAREHLNGHDDHSTTLAGALAGSLAAVGAVTGVSLPLVLVGTSGAFVVCGVALRWAFPPRGRR